MTLGNIFDASQALIILLTRVKPEKEAVPAQQSVHRSKKAERFTETFFLKKT